MVLFEVCIIWIFMVFGMLVCIFEYSDLFNNDRFEIGEGESEVVFIFIEYWDFKNESGIWVGLGVYIVYIELFMGTMFVKFVIIQGSEQIGIF